MSTLLKLYCTRSSHHEEAVSTLSTVFKEFCTVSQSLTTGLFRRIPVVSMEHFTDFEGVYDKCQKTHDCTLKKMRNLMADVDIKFVWEVGVSETNDKLVHKTRMWIEGNVALLMIRLIKQEENPTLAYDTLPGISAITSLLKRNFIKEKG